ncbi:MAG TPA: hypothetical protein VER12_18640 [Polyangiaceae bacterium]|nr:hypothetical protein [Polyangiaceae bacterium]
MPRSLKLALLLLPLALLLGVLLDTPYHALWNGELFGVYRSRQRPPFSVASFWNGTFQPDFEAWLEQELSLKAAMVRTDNTLNLLLLNDISAHTEIPIVLGKRHTLFEMNYINNHNGVSDLKGDPPPRSPYSVAEQTRLVSRAARAFRALGIDFMVVFYPVKATVWSDRVRERYVLPGGAERAAAGYQQLLSALHAEQVHVVDGGAEFARVFAEDPSFPLYNSGGTHWTNIGACQVARLMVAELPLSNPGRSALRCRRGAAHTAKVGDSDISELINVWDNSRFRDQIPTVSVSLSKPLSGGPKKALFVGTSYSEHLVGQLQRAGVIRDVYRLMYYRHPTAAEVAWERVADRKVIVFEQWQWSYFTVNITEFIDDMAAHVPSFASALQQLEGEAP